MDKDIVKKLNDLEIDILKETSNIGSSHAATAVSQMINKRINISVPEIRFAPIDDFKLHLAGFIDDSIEATGVYLELTDEFSGSILYIFSQPSALALSDILMGREAGSSKKLGDMEKSAIMEVGNIIVSAYANALGDFVESKVLLTPPELKEDLPGSVVGQIREKVKDISTALIFNTKMEEADKLFHSYFVLLPHPQSMEKIINKLLTYINE
ncbi:hypothetical protein C0583_06750 [Candidatus Parcubacteria bacterium]|nr:MAG: hypothetical protein C0583_06750 [Candidatus Parcubacteria bacterium]